MTTFLFINNNLSKDYNSKVLLAVGRYPPAHGGGGLRAHRTYQRIQKKYNNFQLCVISECADDLQPGMSNYEGIDIVRIRRNACFIRSFYDVGRMIFSRGNKNIKFIHAIGASYVALAASTWSRVLGIPLVRELTVNSDIPTGNKLSERLYRHGFVKANLLIALNKQIERQFLDVGISSENIWRRPNPVDTNNYYAPNTKDRFNARDYYGYKEQDIIHLMLGRFCTRKNQCFAVETIAHLPGNHHLLLAGPKLEGDDKYYQEVQDTINKYNLENRVRLLPEYIDKPLPLYHLADSCWIPSVVEGLPNTMLEALCSGLLVVVNIELDLAEYFDEENGVQAEIISTKFAISAKEVVKLGLSVERRIRRAEKNTLIFDSEIIDDQFMEHIDHLFLN